MATFIAEGFGLPNATLRSIGRAELADVDEGMEAAPLSQLFRSVMQGAPGEEVRRVTALIEARLDRLIFDHIRRVWDDFDLSIADPRITVPTLYLEPEAALLNYSGMSEAFLHFAPQARIETLQLWPARLHDPAAGYELAGKTLSFLAEHEASAKA
ncbi:MAG: hypothetical protein WEB00_14800 [Dehalococcoidia bacterium]